MAQRGAPGLTSRLIDARWNDNNNTEGRVYVSKIRVYLSENKFDLLSIVAKATTRNVILSNVNEMNHGNSISYDIVVKVKNKDSLDLFIEYQGSEFHGRKPYEGTEEDLQKIKLWKERGDEICKQENKHGSRYHAMVETWSIKDVNKRNIAKQNNLNYIEFWNINEVKKWLNN